MDSKGYVLTPEGKKELEDELKWREGEERDRITEAIRTARGFGDLSENSEYDDAKDSQAVNENRINEIRSVLANSSIMDEPKNTKFVDFGHLVTVEGENGKVRTYKLVGTAEADPRANRISNESPMGKALFGHKKGETVSFLAPSGKKLSYTITDIQIDKG